MECIDTLKLAYALYGEQFKKFNLSNLAKSLKVESEKAHRALHDARTLNNIFMSIEVK